MLALTGETLADPARGAAPGAGVVQPAAVAGGTSVEEALGGMTCAVAGLGRVIVIMLPL